jgi:hypothetical protein
LLSSHFLLAIPGILSDAEDEFAWHEESVRMAWEITQGGLTGESFDYELGLIRWLPKQRREIAKLVKLILRWRTRRLDVVVHSNGSHMITQALGRLIEMVQRGEVKRHELPFFSSIHLVAPSCEADCNLNFLNAAVGMGMVGRVFLYQPQSDRVVKLGHWFRKPVGWVGWGHGNLSVVGFRNVHEDFAASFITIAHGRNHTDAVKPAQLLGTMQLVVANLLLAATPQPPTEGSAP